MSSLKEKLLHEKQIHGLPAIISAGEEKQLLEGMPIQKILGFVDFDNLKIKVEKNVFIPRYETQEVVVEALRYIDQDSRVLDLCCGSGYIGLTVKQKTDCEVVLSDIDDEAIAQTKENAFLNGLQVKILKSNLFENIDGKFDVIIANPPYIPSSASLDRSVLDYEPHLALFGGLDGNDSYRKIIGAAPHFLKNGAHLVFEISPDNALYLISQGFKIIKDINDKERIAVKQFFVP